MSGEVLIESGAVNVVMSETFCSIVNIFLEQMSANCLGVDLLDELLLKDFVYDVGKQGNALVCDPASVADIAKSRLLRIKTVNLVYLDGQRNETKATHLKKLDGDERLQELFMVLNQILEVTTSAKELLTFSLVKDEGVLFVYIMPRNMIPCAHFSKLPEMSVKRIQFLDVDGSVGHVVVSNFRDLSLAVLGTISIEHIESDKNANVEIRVKVVDRVSNVYFYERKTGSEVLCVAPLQEKLRQMKVSDLIAFLNNRGTFEAVLLSDGSTGIIVQSLHKSLLPSIVDLENKKISSALNVVARLNIGNCIPNLLSREGETWFQVYPITRPIAAVNTFMIHGDIVSSIDSASVQVSQLINVVLENFIIGDSEYLSSTLEHLNDVLQNSRTTRMVIPVRQYFYKAEQNELMHGGHLLDVKVKRCRNVNLGFTHFGVAAFGAFTMQNDLLCLQLGIAPKNIRQFLSVCKSLNFRSLKDELNINFDFKTGPLSLGDNVARFFVGKTSLVQAFCYGPDYQHEPINDNIFYVGSNILTLNGHAYKISLNTSSKVNELIPCAWHLDLDCDNVYIKHYKVALKIGGSLSRDKANYRVGAVTQSCFDAGAYSLTLGIGYNVNFIYALMSNLPLIAFDQSANEHRMLCSTFNDDSEFPVFLSWMTPSFRNLRHSLETSKTADGVVESFVFVGTDSGNIRIDVYSQIFGFSRINYEVYRFSNFFKLSFILQCVAGLADPGVYVKRSLIPLFTGQACLNATVMSSFQVKIGFVTSHGFFFGIDICK